MSFIKKFSILVMVAALSIGNAFARSATDEENASFKSSLNEYVDIMSKNDFEKLIDNTIPPSFFKQLETLANGASVDTIKSSVKASLKQLSSSMTISDVKIDEANIKSGELDNGEPYFIIPSTAVITVNGQKMNLTNEFVGIHEDGKWYFIDPSRPQQKAMLAKSFPGIEKANITPPAVEPIK